MPTSILAAPNVAPYRPELALPTDGSPFGAKINAFMADCKNHGYSCGYLQPGFVFAEVPVAIPNSFDLIGMGRYAQGGPNSWGGGVKIQSPLNATAPAISMVGTSTTGGITLDGYIQRPGLMNMCVMGALQNTVAVARDNPPLIDCQHVYKLRMENIYAGNDFIRALRLADVWDSNIADFWSNSGGFSDPAAAPDNPAALAYTGRSAALGVETAIGRSLGVPNVEIVSPNTTGADVSNNIRITNLFIESNAHNGVPLMVRGGNTNAIQIIGSKIEAVEGCVPLIVLDGAVSFYYRGWLYAAGTGAPYVQVGSVAAGTKWSTFTTPAALVLAYGCYSPEIEGNGGYAAGAGTGSPDSLLRFIRCEDPKVNFSVANGLDRLTGARMNFDTCQQVSASHTRCYAPSYLTSASGANLTERTTTNSTAVA